MVPDGSDPGEVAHSRTAYDLPAKPGKGDSRLSASSGGFPDYNRSQKCETPSPPGIVGAASLSNLTCPNPPSNVERSRGSHGHLVGVHRSAAAEVSAAPAGHPLPRLRGRARELSLGTAG